MVSSIHHISIEVPWGVVHGRTGRCQDGDPIILLHQTPRSGDEFREVIETMGTSHHLLALDLPGMGHSTPHPDGDSIEAYAAAIVAAVQRWEITRAVVVGHHTGAAVAATVAAAAPNVVKNLVLSSPPWIDEEVRQARRARTGPGVDEVTEAHDGSHLIDLWAGRAAFYPPGRPDLLRRFLSDALLVADPGAGHRAVTEWAMEPLLPIIRTLPVVLVDHQADPHATENIARWQAALDNPAIITIPDGMVPLEFTAAAFVDGLSAALEL